MAKPIDVQRMSITSMIVHDIPKHKFGDFTLEPTYSKTESTLTDGLRIFFKQKIVDALKSDRAIKVVFNDESESPISLLTSELFTSESKLISNSMLMTKHLFEIQGGNNSGGILVIMFCKAGSQKAIILMKLERDNGVQLKIDPLTSSIDILEVQNLMLTQRTKVFKIALMPCVDDYEIDYDGIVMDFQIDVKARNDSHTFFISDFLGCRPFKDPKTTTQEFYKHTKAYIKLIDDEIKRAKYTQDLNSYLQKNSQKLSPKEFAEDYLTTAEHRDRYKEFLKSKNFKMESFIKDTSLISNKIEKISVEFENGITILGKKGTFENKVKMTKADNGKHKAEIISKIKKIE